MNITELFDQLSSLHSFDWMEVSDLLWEAGYGWEWISHRDGTEVFLLKDREIEQ